MNNMHNNFVKYGGYASMQRRPMSFDMHQYNFFNQQQPQSIGFHVPATTHNHYEPAHSLRRDHHPPKHNRLKKPPLPPRQTINLDELSDENSSFSEDDFDDLSSSHNAFCSTSDMTTSDSEIYTREAKLKYMDHPYGRRMNKKRSAAISLESNFPSFSPIYPEDLISSENEEENFEIDDDFLKIPSTCPLTPLRMPKGLEMIEEVSPILPDNDIQTEEELPPSIKPLKFNKEWRPIQTSTMTSFHPLRLPKTNPRLNSAASTPRHTAARRRMLTPVDNYEEPKSLFDPCYVDMASAKKNTLKAKHFGFPSQIAKNFGVKGILYLEIYIIGRTLDVKVKNAIYFEEQRISSFVKLELKPNLKRKHRKRSKEDRKRRFKQERTITIPHTNRPSFDASFQLSNYECHDMLGINVYSTRSSSMGSSENKLLGCMSFHLRRLFKKGSLDTKIFEDDSCEAILVGSGGYFLLNELTGSHQNMPENKVNHRKYYDEIGSSMSLGSSSLNSSPSKIIGEPDYWRAAMHFSSNHLYSDQRVHPGQEVLTRLAVSPCKKPLPRGEKDADKKRQTYRNSTKMTPWPTASTSEPNTNRVVNTLDYTSSSSSNSGLGHDYKRHYRFTLPSITTSDTTGSEISNDCRNGAIVDYNYLYADPSSQKHPEGPTKSQLDSHEDSSKENKENGLRHHDEKFVRPVRRVQSFATERDTLTKRKQERKKSNFGAIGRTFHFLKHKIDSAMSTSTLCPSHEEVRQWADSFESLINHKFGCILFQDFLKNEYSDENIRFWFEVEEFKKMKPSKKAHARAQQIFDEYIREQAPNEVNLDSGTKAATKAALEDGAKPDTFNLAQSRIFNLMKKDSYPRFLKTSSYLELLGTFDSHKSSQASIASVDPSAYNIESKRGSAASDTGTITVHIDSPQHVVLVE